MFLDFGVGGTSVAVKLFFFSGCSVSSLPAAIASERLYWLGCRLGADIQKDTLDKRGGGRDGDKEHEEERAGEGTKDKRGTSAHGWRREWDGEGKGREGRA